MATASPEVEAQRVLQQVWVRADGELELPVDPVEVARYLGIEVYTATLDTDVSAVIVANADGPATIYVSNVDAWVRQRFSCAHEIGHYIRRTADGSREFGFVDRRDHIAGLGVDREERWANQFAAALLMPADIVRRSAGRTPAVMAKEFGVSIRAMTLRLRNLGITP